LRCALSLAFPGEVALQGDEAGALGHPTGGVGISNEIQRTVRRDDPPAEEFGMTGARNDGDREGYAGIM
jgi:hypothetical protein